MLTLLLFVLPMFKFRSTRLSKLMISMSMLPMTLFLLIKLLFMQVMLLFVANFDVCVNYLLPYVADLLILIL